MSDVKAIRADPAAFDAGLDKRGLEPIAKSVIELDESVREAKTNLQGIQARRNKLSKEIGAAKARGEDTRQLVRDVSLNKGM